MLLYERGEYREAAAFTRRVSSPTYRQIVTELPIDRFVDAMPHSMPVLEAIYAKVPAQTGSTVRARNETKHGQIRVSERAS